MDLEQDQQNAGQVTNPYQRSDLRLSRSVQDHVQLSVQDHVQICPDLSRGLTCGCPDLSRSVVDLAQDMSTRRPSDRRAEGVDRWVGFKQKRVRNEGWRMIMDVGYRPWGTETGER